MGPNLEPKMGPNLEPEMEPKLGPKLGAGPLHIRSHAHCQFGVPPGMATHYQPKSLLDLPQKRVFFMRYFSFSFIFLSHGRLISPSPPLIFLSARRFGIIRRCGGLWKSHGTPLGHVEFP